MIAALCLAATPVVAQEGPDAARAQAEMIALAIDADANGELDREEVRAYGAVVFDTLDIDGDDQLTRDEIAAFRFGMTEIAEFRGRQQAYDTAQTILFDIFDRDNDHLISLEEHANGFRRAYHLADLDEDGSLSMKEYGEGFIFNIAMRAALAN